MTASQSPPLSLEQQLRQIVLLSSSIDEAELNDESKLLEFVDSLGIAEIFEFVEDRIGRPLAEEEMTRETFATIASVAALIRARAGA